MTAIAELFNALKGPFCTMHSENWKYVQFSYSSPHSFIVFFKIPFNIILPFTTKPYPSAFRYQHTECSDLPTRATYPPNLILLDSVSWSIQFPGFARLSFWNKLQVDDDKGEALLEWYWQEKTKYWETNPVQCHCVYLKSYRDWPGKNVGPPR